MPPPPGESDRPPPPADFEPYLLWKRRDGQVLIETLPLAGPQEDPRAGDSLTLHHPVRRGVTRTLDREEISEIEPLHVEVMDQGRRLGEPEPMPVMCERRQADLGRLDTGVRRLINPHVYHVSLTTELWQLKRQLVAETRATD